MFPNAFGLLQDCLTLLTNNALELDKNLFTYFEIFVVLNKINIFLRIYLLGNYGIFSIKNEAYKKKIPI